MYSSRRTPLFQKQPEYFTRYRNRQGKPAPKGFTESIQSYVKEAGKELTLLLRNRELQEHPYRWAATINLEKALSPKDINTTWARIARKLKRSGVVAYRIAEPSKANKVHFHLLVKSSHTEAELKRIVAAATDGIDCRTHVSPIEDEFRYVAYILKARIEVVVGGKLVKDYHSPKRLLFQSKTGIRKVGTVGKFWVQPKAKIWESIRQQQQQLGEAVASPEMKCLIQYLYADFFGKTIPKKQLERQIGLNVEEPAIKEWAAEVQKARRLRPSSRPRLPRGR
jgi:hypothetical protein